MTAGDETAADLLAAGTENISLAEEFPFLREVIHFLSGLYKKYTFSSCFELLKSVRRLINRGDSFSKFQ